MPYPTQASMVIGSKEALAICALVIALLLQGKI
jgi:hypothetical protein